jgi:hypothetical protein
MMKTLMTLIILTLCFPSFAMDLETAKAQCEEIAIGLNAGDPQPFNNMVSNEAFLRRFKKFPMPDDMQGSIQQAAGALQMMSQQFTMQAQQGALVTFLGVGPFKDAKHTGRFRIVLPQTNGYVYFFAMLEEENDKIVIGDIFTHNLSMWMSEYMLQTIVLGSGDKVGVEAYNAFWEQEVSEEEKKAISAFYIKVLTNPAEAVNEFDTMPDYVKQKASVVSTLLTMSNRAAPEALDKAIAIGQKYTPDSPLVQMFLVAKYSQEQSLEQALKALEEIYKILGKDAYYYYQKANMYAVAANHDEALKAYKSSREKEASFYPPYVDEAWIFVLKEDFDQAVAVLKMCEENTDIQFDRATFVEDPDFAGLIATEAFNKWKPEAPMAVE